MNKRAYQFYCRICEKGKHFDEMGYCNGCGNHADRVAIIPEGYIDPNWKEDEMDWTNRGHR